MKAGDGSSLPAARKDQLIAEELPDELLIYDLTRHKAHCLNRASAFVWKRCDGKKTVSQLSKLLAKELGTTVDDDVVWLAQSQLRRFHPLEDENNSLAWMKVSRRDLVSLPAVIALSPNPFNSFSRCGPGSKRLQWHPGAVYERWPLLLSASILLEPCRRRILPG